MKSSYAILLAGGAGLLALQLSRSGSGRGAPSKAPGQTLGLNPSLSPSVASAPSAARPGSASGVAASGIQVALDGNKLLKGAADWFKSVFGTTDQETAAGLNPSGKSPGGSLDTYSGENDVTAQGYQPNAADISAMEAAGVNYDSLGIPGYDYSAPSEAFPAYGTDYIPSGSSFDGGFSDFGGFS